MPRSRIVAAGVGVAALGIATVLVPTVSSADQSTTAAPAGTVEWVDSQSDVALLPAAPDSSLGDRWYGATFGAGSGDGSLATKPLTAGSAFGPNGLTLTGSEPVVLARGFAEPMPAADLPAAFEGASVTAQGSTNFSILVHFPDGTTQAEFPSSNTTSNVDGAQTTWGPDGAQVGTQEFADELAAEGATVVGYAEYLGLAIEGSQAPNDAATDAPVAPMIADTAPEATATGPATPAAAPAAAPDTTTPDTTTQAATPQADVAPAAPTVLRSITFDDVTTDFTPQPVAQASVPDTTLTRADATTTGTPVAGTGFVPGETVRVGVVQGGRAEGIDGTTFTADAGGAVIGRVVLPADFVTGAGSYDLVLVGDSSSQRAAVTLTITDPGAAAGGTTPTAVPATPVRAKATFTG
ncbi:hypothetical protein HUN59_17240 [Curtobacterium sp. Csp2]|uniref:hypothetical protein n=1 Tax=Curtobacterium sp. Csp2 TaxID=2495430 RepID=UPI0015809E30|nr:hypothetical protein [Curtobacterium sp. Csp2]QKS17728.1 hypothetical protein HUN59_17240 [Curtobacterium sp. Csp2]